MFFKCNVIKLEIDNNIIKCKTISEKCMHLGTNSYMTFESKKNS